MPRLFNPVPVSLAKHVIDALSDQLRGGVPDVARLLAHSSGLYFQHLLPSNVPFLLAQQRLARQLNSQPPKTAALGKFYSAMPAVQRELMLNGMHVFNTPQPSEWGHYYGSHVSAVRQFGFEFAQQIKRQGTSPLNLVISDSGSTTVIDEIYTQVGVQQPTAYIEQTTRGLFSIRHMAKNLNGFVINIAESALKKEIESQIIALNLISGIESVLAGRDTIRLGVIGAAGTIGKALVSTLTSQFSQHHPGKKVEFFAYNLRRNKMTGVLWLDSLAETIAVSDIIFSATGSDISRLLTQRDMRDLLQDSPREKILVNLASADEFEDLLRFLQRERRHGAVHNYQSLAPIHVGNVTLLKSGMPYNLAAALDWPSIYDHPTDFALTRGLMFSGVIQAAVMAELGVTDAAIYSLSPSLQRFVLALCAPELKARYPQQALLHERMAQLSDVDAISQLNGGESLPDVVEERLSKMIDPASMLSFGMK